MSDIPVATASVKADPDIKRRRPPLIFHIQLDDVGWEHLNHFHGDQDDAWAAAMQAFTYGPGPGPGDISPSGNDGYPYTPTIDRLINEGMAFRRAYATPLCSPSKAAVLTGRMSGKTGISGVLGENDTIRLDESEVCSPKVATAAGSAYQTLHCGKWHLTMGHYDIDIPVGGTVPMVIQQSGNDKYIGTPENMNNDPNDGYGGTADAPGTQYLEYDSDTNLHTDKIGTYVGARERTNIKNWCTLLSPKAPWKITWFQHLAHTPYHWPPLALHTQSTKYTPISAWLLFKAMIETADTLIQRTLDDLAVLGYPEDEMIILVMSDNGSSHNMVDPTYSAAWPPPANDYDLTHFKKTAYETGTRVPLIIKGPGIQPGAVCDDLVWCCDIAPTINQLMAKNYADHQPDEFDGKSLVPLFSNPNTTVRAGEPIYIACWKEPGYDINASNVYDLTVAAWEEHTDYKLVVVKDLPGDDVTDEFYKVGTPARWFDKDEQDPLDVNTGTTRQEAYQRLRDYIIEQTGLIWPTSSTA